MHGAMPRLQVRRSRCLRFFPKKVSRLACFFHSDMTKSTTNDKYLGGTITRVLYHDVWSLCIAHIHRAGCRGCRPWHLRHRSRDVGDVTQQYNRISTALHVAVQSRPNLHRHPPASPDTGSCLSYRLTITHQHQERTALIIIIHASLHAQSVVSVV